jgi:hypothetical protein
MSSLPCSFYELKFLMGVYVPVSIGTMVLEEFRVGPGRYSDDVTVRLTYFSLKRKTTFSYEQSYHSMQFVAKHEPMQDYMLKLVIEAMVRSLQKAETEGSTRIVDETQVKAILDKLYAEMYKELTEKV